jgi:hypothetical protein
LFERIAADRPVRISAAPVDNDLTRTAKAQHWRGQSRVLNSDDSCTGNVLTVADGANAAALSRYVGLVVAPSLSASLGASHVSGFIANGAGEWNLILAKPSPVATGSAGVAINLGPGMACQTSYDRDPPARHIWQLCVEDHQDHPCA